MNVFSLLLTVAGLSLFEIISSIDNAIVNADVLHTMQPRARKWFLVWGLLFAVFVLRGLLPWIIVWGAMPQLGPIGAFTATFSNDPQILEVIEKSAPILLVGGGTFLVFLFLHWLFLEDKNFGLPRTEKFFLKQGIWFYAIASILLCVLVWMSLQKQQMMAFGTVVGSTAFFIVHGFKQNAEAAEAKLLDKTKSDISKILYLEVIDATFSMDGILGAFAFTLSVPLILIGNGIGAFVVREFTVRSVEKIKKYRYLKNGAMYSILFLGITMVVKSFGAPVPEWVSPVITFGVIGFFLYKSKRAINEKN